MEPHIKSILIHLKTELPSVKEEVDKFIAAGKDKPTLLTYLHANLNKPATVDLLRKTKDKLTLYDQGQMISWLFNICFEAQDLTTKMIEVAAQLLTNEKKK
jgi:hypothetical protein